MGYRWDCEKCGFIGCHEDELKKKNKHSTLTGHNVYGGAEVWKHFSGTYFKWLYDKGYAGYACKEYWRVRNE